MTARREGLWRRGGWLALAMLGGLLSGCGDRTPTGQVVAVVGDTDITRRDVAAQIGGGVAPQVQARARETALEAVIQRELLARAARQRRIDASPDYLAAIRRARTDILIARLEASVLADLPPPTDAEIDAFITAHPQMFAERMQITAAQTRTGAPAAASDTVTIDSALLAAPIARQLATTAINAPTAIDVDGQVRTLRILARAPVPVTGRAAIDTARQVIMRQRLDQALARIVSEERARTPIRYRSGTGPAAR